jgi:hypothetical protein
VPNFACRRRLFSPSFPKNTSRSRTTLSAPDFPSFLSLSSSLRVQALRLFQHANPPHRYVLLTFCVLPVLSLTLLASSPTSPHPSLVSSYPLVLPLQPPRHSHSPLQAQVRPLPIRPGLFPPPLPSGTRQSPLRHLRRSSIPSSLSLPWLILANGNRRWVPPSTTPALPATSSASIEDWKIWRSLGSTGRAMSIWS